MDLPKLDETGKLAFKNYELVREKVIYQMDEMLSTGFAKPSEYWEEELGGIDFMFEATPLIINKLRLQSYHITGLKHHDYRSTHRISIKSFEKKFNNLKTRDKNNLFIGEPNVLGGYGHIIDGVRINIDTLKFYESLIALDEGGVLDNLKAKRHPIIAEVGSGWGGFAYQMKKTIPNATYILIDLPPLFLFSAVYLLTLYPGSKILFVNSAEDEKEFENNIENYDFVFVPHYKFNKIWKKPIDLALNMISFQEMRTDQVDNYVKTFKKSGVRWLYSHNRDRSFHNNELSAVSEIIGKYYDLKTLEILDGPYTNLDAPLPVKLKKDKGPGLVTIWRNFKLGRKSGDFRLLFTSIKNIFRKSYSKKYHVLEYRHYVGQIRKDSELNEMR